MRATACGARLSTNKLPRRVSCSVSAGDKLTFELKNTYAQLNAFDWSN